MHIIDMSMTNQYFIDFIDFIDKVSNKSNIQKFSLYILESL
jgi:hypothetical protein